MKVKLKHILKKKHKRKLEINAPPTSRIKYKFRSDVEKEKVHTDSNSNEKPVKKNETEKNKFPIYVNKKKRFLSENEEINFDDFKSEDNKVKIEEEKVHNKKLLTKIETRKVNIPTVLNEEKITEIEIQKEIIPVVKTEKKISQIIGIKKVKIPIVKTTEVAETTTVLKKKAIKGNSFINETNGIKIQITGRFSLINTNNEKINKIIDTKKTTTSGSTGKYRRRSQENRERNVIVESYTSTNKKLNDSYGILKKGGIDDMKRKVVVESYTSKTSGGKYGKGSYDNKGRKVFFEATSQTVTKKQGSGYGAIYETKTTTTTTKGGKSGSGYLIQNLALTKSGNKKDWKSSGTKGIEGSSKITFKETNKGGLLSSSTGMSYYKEERKTTKVTGEKSWEYALNKSNEVFTKKQDSKYQLSKGSNYSKISKYTGKQTTNLITKG